ncbi:methyl-accepting chemotaxis protein [Atopomonas sediminilitoris]|uniref:methyl-accepting chemotaxis protein n=1 Tax=Atopomonas sediminilitoris TaxID=2919919 RepID=UPI001F4D5299|nr:methyl-accepting chemotaxis protein [Atopomonas sediminilitoris]MCJ8168054.1 methyl-accepting chemotaxis protein [Atopomonas sediminilitoris]
MLLKRLSIQWRILLLSAISLLMVVSVLVGLSIYRAGEMRDGIKDASQALLDDWAKKRIDARGREWALTLQSEFRDAFNYGRGLAAQVEFLRSQQQKRMLAASGLREDMTAQIRGALEDFPDLIGVYVAFEPDGLDRKDYMFANQQALGSNDKGRFSVYWSWDDSRQPSLEVMSEENLGDTTPGPSGAPYNAWYTCPLQTKQTCVLEPYVDQVAGQDTLMTSIAYPLHAGERIVGVVGLDISLKNFQSTASHGSDVLFEGHGEISIFSPSGLIAGSSNHATLLGKPVKAELPELHQAMGDLLGSTAAKGFNSNDMLSFYSPIVPIPGAKPWGLLLQVPEKVLLRPALELAEQMDSQNLVSTNLALISGLVMSVIGLLLAWLNARSVVTPLQQVSARLKEIATGDGDLTQRLRYNNPDELGELSGWFNRFLDKLQPIIADVKTSVVDARATADSAANIAGQTSNGMQQQFREIEQVATASQEMSHTAHEVTSSAAQAAEAARSAEGASSQGMQVINATTGSIDTLARDMSTAMARVEKLADNSEQIGSVLEVIRAIAEQTNLLALNAAIEAARAGEQGRGFAVVADEVRNLAKRTQDSVEEIRQVIEDLQKGTVEVVGAMQSSHQHAQGSVSQVQKAVEALDKIRQSVSVINDMNLQIASAAEEQSAVAEEVTRNVAGIRDVTESLSGQADESARISQALNDLASHQQQLMEQFRT